MNEAETRAELIDPALKAAGWGVVEGSRVRREVITLGRLQGAGVRAAQDIADYVLTYRNHKLAVIEAKRRDLPDTEGLGQAKKYAEKLQTRFAYSTNGIGIYQVDMTTGAEQYITAYPTPAELWNAVFAEQKVWRDRFAAIPFEDGGGKWQPRYYIDIAVRRVLEAIVAGSRPHSADDGDRHRQDLRRFSHRLEALPKPLEPDRLENRRRANAPAAHPIPGRSQRPGGPSL